MLKSSYNRVRSPAVAGAFYPAQAHPLQQQIIQFLEEAETHDHLKPKALIVPHAGYVYSGAIAAAAYKMLLPLKDTIRRVVLLGPAHRVYLEGMAVPSAEFFRTPLGNIPIATETAQLPQRFDSVVTRDEAHAQEHSLEVHLPFLQQTLSTFTLIPVVVGKTPSQQVKLLLDDLWGGDETLIVISSDLSHFHPYAEAQRLDLQTAKAIEAFETDRLTHDGACGFYPLGGMLAKAKKDQLHIHRVDLRNSGDTAGDKARVVGYGSWILTED